MEGMHGTTYFIMADQPKSLIGILQMGSAMFLSGIIGVLVIETDLPPTSLVFWRCVIGFVPLLLYCLVSPAVRSHFRDVRALALGLASGLFIVTNWILFFHSFQHINYSLSTIIYHVFPFFTLLLGHVFLKERVHADHVLWTIFAFLGFLLIADVARVFASSQMVSMQGVLLTLGACFLYSSATIIVKRTPLPPILIVTLQLFSGIVMLSIIELGHFSSPFSDPGTAASVLALGLLSTAALYVLLYSALHRLTIRLAAVLFFLYPLFTVVLDYLVYGNRLTAWQLAGALLIFLGTLGVKLSWSPRILVERISKQSPERNVLK